MKEQITARAHVLGDNIDTDQICPGRYLELTDPKEIARHALEGADASLASRFLPGELLIAGRNFGCGSSREHAAIALLHMGASAVLSESFARIFYRNAINLALPLMVCPGISAFAQDGDVLEVDLASGLVKNQRSAGVLQGEKISDHAMEILKAGGIKPLFLKRTGKV